MEMSSRFLIAINRVLGHEGGYVNNPSDPGGETNWGISKRSYPNVDIKNLSRDEAIAIYYKDFWVPIHAEETTQGVDYQLLDSAVNSGILQTIRFMQRALNVADDGYWGIVTIEAMRDITKTDFIMRFLAERLEFMSKLNGWTSFGRGWAKRIAQNLRYGAQDS